MKAICFVLMLVTGFYGFKSCKKSFNCEGDQYVTVQATVVSKYIGSRSVGTFGGSEPCGYLVLKPNVPNPKVYVESVSFKRDYALNEGNKTTLQTRRFLISEDHYDGEGFGYGLLGTPDELIGYSVACADKLIEHLKGE